ncbi:hypothetical protein PHYPSEUDO_001523 [Phytophthora pseudosyringae]|uniref:Crinkler (CRN) family protein n=1 Tax=Phytophthora pseudosyringae TaxID=221518 RepID=A0A8T1W0D7_9STRA|nr:hypothetical protein PHYPSEUDO_001523 [Phytophthora pseudosyringae]
MDSNGDFDDMKAQKNVVKRIGSSFVIQYGSRPCALDPEAFEDFEEVLENLTNEAGPLFIAIDVIGEAFNHIKLKDDIVRRERFMTFCEQVLSLLFTNEKLFFLIAGRASFMNYVGMRPTGDSDSIKPSPFKFARLSLRLLQSPAIQEILRNTYVDEKKAQTLVKHYTLADHQMETNREVMLGLAVKNYSSTGAKVTEATVKAECMKFNRMCTSSVNRLNILIVCATSYGTNLSRKFQTRNGKILKSAVYSNDNYADIDEILLMNLTTQENRAEFFDIQGSEGLKQALEDVIEKTQVEAIDLISS